MIIDMEILKIQVTIHNLYSLYLSSTTINHIYYLSLEHICICLESQLSL